MIFFILWIPLSILLGYYDVEHNFLMGFCATVIIACLSPSDKG